MTRKISRREALIGVSALVASTGMVELALGASGKSITIRVKDIERLEGMRGKELLNVRLPDRRRRSGWHAAACEAYRQTPTASSYCIKDLALAVTCQLWLRGSPQLRISACYEFVATKTLQVCWVFA
ncbi:MAG: hypothetical protein WBN09_05840 [Woeseiaceae bacterium]